MQKTNASKISLIRQIVLSLFVVSLLLSPNYKIVDAQALFNCYLRIINESPNLLYVTIVPVNGSSDAQLPSYTAVEIPGRGNKMFILPPGTYDITTENFNIPDPIVNNITFEAGDSYEIYNNAPDQRDESVLARQLVGEGYKLQNEYKYEEAIIKFTEAIDQWKAIDNRFEQGRTLHLIGQSYTAINRYEDAIKNYLESLALFQSIDEKEYSGLVMKSLGWAYREFDDYHLSQALKYAQFSVDTFRPLGNPYELFESLILTATIYNALDDFPNAEKNYLEASKIAEQMKMKPMLTSAYSGLNNLYYNEKDYQKALDYALKSLNLYKSNERIDAATIIGNLGATYSALGEYDKALPLLKEALGYQQQLNDRDGESFVLTELGEIYEGKDDIENAVNYYKLAVEVKESILNDLQFGDLKASYANGKKQIYPYIRLIDLLHNQDRYDEAFAYIERTRARGFINQMANGIADYKSNPDSPLLKNEMELKKKIQSLREKILQNGENESQLQAELDSFEKEYQQTIEQLRLQNPQTAAIENVGTLSLADFQTTLDQDTVAIDYFVLSEEEVIVYVITQDDYHAQGITVNYDDLETLLKTFYFSPDPQLNNPELANRQLAQMYHWLIAPIEGKVAEYNRPIILFIPHDIVHYVPFPALYDGSKYLVDRYTIYEIPSASAFSILDRNPERKIQQKILVFANPLRDDPNNNLPFAEEEAQNIKDIFGEKGSYLPGPDATKTKMINLSPDYNIIHIAAHGSYNSENPLFSALSFSPDDINDGQLDVNDIYQLKLPRTDLVVLSACQTQIGNVEKHNDDPSEGGRVISRGDDVVAFSRAFFYSGVPTVVASLWNVNDKASSELMGTFYQNLQKGDTVAEALRRAQISTKAKYKSPNLWAAFVISGNGNLQMEQNLPPPSNQDLPGQDPIQETPIPTKPFCSTPFFALIVIALVTRKKISKVI